MPTPETEKTFHWPILGHSQIKQYLQSCLLKKTVAHAYLFVGPLSIGKYLTARYLTASLLCQTAHERKPCQACQSCQQLSKDIHPDVTTVRRETDKKNISIQQIRELQHTLSLRSFLTSYKVAIIDEAETMNEEAANALLKTLEEPTPQTILLLIAEQREWLPATIISRCQTMYFNLVPSYQIENWLLLHGVDKKEAAVLTQYASGRPGLAIRAQHNGALLTQHDERIKRLIEMIRGTLSERLSAVNAVVAQEENNSHESYTQLLSDWLSFFRDILLYKNDLTALTHRSFRQTMSLFNKQYTTLHLLTIMTALQQAKQYLGQSINPRLVLENIALVL